MLAHPTNESLSPTLVFTKK